MSWQDDEQLLEQLGAFADGELPIEQQPALLAFMAEHPEAARWLAGQQRLTAVLRKKLIAHADPAPPALRARVEQLSIQPPNKPQRRVSLNWFAAVAATLLIGWLIFTRPHPTAAPDAESAPVLPASVIATASRIHDDCSRVAEVSEKLHSAPFPADRGALAAGIERDLHSEQPRPDLSSIGFHYVGAGPCGHTLPDAIHLLYHTDHPHTQATISVFVQPYTGQYPLELGRVYTVSVEQSPFPMLAWRSEDVVYFLLADNTATEQAALALIHK